MGITDIEFLLRAVRSGTLAAGKTRNTCDEQALVIPGGPADKFGGDLWKKGTAACNSDF
jgi:hypothetical protein